MLAKIGVLEMAVASPQRRQTTRRERQPQHDIADFADGQFALFGIEDGKAIAGDRMAGAAVARQHVAQADAGAAGGSAEFGLPPMLDEGKCQPDRESVGVGKGGSSSGSPRGSRNQQ